MWGRGPGGTAPCPLPHTPTPNPLKGGGRGSGGGRGTFGPPALPLILILLLLAPACGKKVAPLSPDEVLPGPVREFRLSQEGESLVLSWLFPLENRLGQPLTQLKGFSLYRCETDGVAPDRRCLKDFAVLADIDLSYPRVGQVQGEAVVFRDTRLRPGRRYEYKVAAYGPRRYLGDFAPALSHAWGVLPQAPRDLKAQPGDRSVTLTWTPVARLADGSPTTDLAGYRVYRRDPGRSAQRVTPQLLPEPVFQEVALMNGVEYTYTVRAVRRVGPDFLESLDSPAVTVLPRDTTPPPPLLNLMAVPTAKGVELRWDESPAKDLAGYRVYRRAGGEPRFTLLTPKLLARPYFVDTQASPGRTWIYYVTAVDDAQPPNESLPSEEAEVTR